MYTVRKAQLSFNSWPRDWTQYTESEIELGRHSPGHRVSDFGLGRSRVSDPVFEF